MPVAKLTYYTLIQELIAGFIDGPATFTMFGDSIIQASLAVCNLLSGDGWSSWGNATKDMEANAIPYIPCTPGGLALGLLYGGISISAAIAHFYLIKHVAEEAESFNNNTGMLSILSIRGWLNRLFKLFFLRGGEQTGARDSHNDLTHQYLTLCGAVQNVLSQEEKQQYSRLRTWQIITLFGEFLAKQADVAFVIMAGALWIENRFLSDEYDYIKFLTKVLIVLGAGGVGQAYAKMSAAPMRRANLNKTAWNLFKKSRKEAQRTIPVQNELGDQRKGTTEMEELVDIPVSEDSNSDVSSEHSLRNGD